MVISDIKPGGARDLAGVIGSGSAMGRRRQAMPAVRAASRAYQRGTLVVRSGKRGAGTGNRGVCKVEGLVADGSGVTPVEGLVARPSGKGWGTRTGTHVVGIVARPSGKLREGWGGREVCA
jgi:hypothetical protein